MTMMRDCEAAFAIVDISSKKMKWDEMRWDERRRLLYGMVIMMMMMMMMMMLLMTTIFPAWELHGRSSSSSSSSCSSSSSISEWKKEEKDDQYLVDCSKLYLWMAAYSLTEAYNFSLSLSLSISLFPSKQNTGESGKLGVVFEMVVGLLSFLPDWSLT